MREIRGHHNSLHCCWMTVQTSRYTLGDKKNPQHPKKSKHLSKILRISYPFIVTFLWTLLQGNATLRHQTLMASPYHAWDPHPHPTWHLQVLPAAKQHLHTQTPRECCSSSAGCRQVKQTLAELPEQLQRFYSPGTSLAPKFGLATPTTSPMPGKACSTLEALGWLLTLVSPFHVLF